MTRPRYRTVKEYEAAAIMRREKSAQSRQVESKPDAQELGWIAYRQWREGAEKRRAYRKPRGPLRRLIDVLTGA